MEKEQVKATKVLLTYLSNLFTLDTANIHPARVAVYRRAYESLHNHQLKKKQTTTT